MSPHTNCDLKTAHQFRINQFSFVPVEGFDLSGMILFGVSISK